MLDNTKAVIFDLDGTLIDSMWVWEKIDIDYLTKRGLSLPEDLRDDIAHLSFEDTAKYFKARFELPDTIEQIQAEWSDMALYEYTHNIELKPGADEFLRKLRNKGIKIALATSNSKHLLEISLKKNNIFHYFDVISTTDEVSRAKDYPDIYLLSAQRLGIEPEYCIVFEDILPAVMSAKSAGMKVIGVYDNAARHQKEEITEIADKFIFEYDELNKAV
jgi:HAD superfamily hydrolase (TIGR01509 family)